MARVALLIGTEKYGTAFGRLEATPRNVHALAAVLENPLMGGFDSVEKLIDPDHSKMGETIETWLRSRDKKDLILLYIAGHGVKDVARQLYFAASTSRKVEGELVTSTAVSAQNVQGWLRTSAKRQIVILDCCFSGAFGDLLAQDDGSVDVESALGAEGRVVLTSSSSMQYSFQQREGELSVYTHHLIEGIRTGAADLDDDGKISTDELHEYTCRKVQEESHGMHPKIIVTKDEGYRLKVANTPLNDPLVKYRKEVEKIVAEDENEICEVFSRPYLEELQQKLEISVEIAQTIEDAVLEPIRQYQSKLQKYRGVVDKAVNRGMYPFGDRETKRLKQLQNSWGLSEADTSGILGEAIANLPIPEPNLASPKGDLGGSPSSQPIEPNPPKTIVYPTFKFKYATIDQTCKIQKHPGEAHHFRETINGVDFELVQIPAGSFEMGSDQNDSEKPIHLVTVPEFFMGKYPVTQSQWKTIANLKQKNRKLDPDPSHFKGADRPVENVNWENAVEFCDRLSDHTGRLYRLPSEAEWEYSCRAGTTTAYHFGEAIDPALANYERKHKETTTVGKFPGNSWGLFDCHGNVWEWCADVWHPNYTDGPRDGSSRIIGANTKYHSGRGGSWAFPAVYSRSASRDSLTRVLHDNLRGFRLVLSVVGGSPRAL
jgi:formylglycine-generating enzyme required for sulfatase activity